MLFTATSDFFCVPQGPVIDKIPYFPQFDKKKSQLENKFKKLSIQSNFNGSNTFRTMKICSRQG